VSAEATAVPTPRTDVLALGAAGVTVLLWASAFVGIRAAGDDFSPGALALGRLTVAAVVLGLIVVARREPLPLLRDLPLIALCGLLWLGAYSVLLNAAERRVDAGTAAMLVNVGPVLIAVLAGLALREGFPATLLGGLAIAFAGCVVIAAASSEDGVSAGWGAVFCVVAAFAYACAVVLQKPLLARSSPLQVTWIACAVATVACLPFAPTLVGEVGGANAGTLAWTAYLGAFPTAIGFITWAYALKRTTAGRMGSTTYLVSPIAILLGWAVLGEAPPALAVLGGALCLAGVVVTRR
jgi:drug/metabolite transporter (DMT)-like permease